MHFVVFCADKANSLDLRMATRPAHLEYLASRGSQVLLGGPYVNEQGEPIGSMLVIEAADQAAADAFGAADPYAKAGLFSSVVIRPWRQTVGPALSPT